MFFNERLMCRGGRVREAWACAWTLGVGAVHVDYARRPVHDVCVDLKRWLRSRSEDPRRRLSLRAAATLVAGAVSTYRLQVDDLYSDAVQLIGKLESIRRQSTTSFGSYHDDAPSSESCSKSRSSRSSMDTSSDDRLDCDQMPTPETMRRKISAKFWPDISSIRTSSEGTVNLEISSHPQMIDVSNTRDSNVLENNINPDKTSILGTSNGNSSDALHVEDELWKENNDERIDEEEKDESITESFTKRLKRPKVSKSTSSSCDDASALRSKRNRRDSESISDNDVQRVGTVNMATQTDAVLECNQMENSQNRTTDSTFELGSYSNQSFDNLPFGITFVYKTRQDKIPSKLIMASLNPKILSELNSTCPQ